MKVLLLLSLAAAFEEDHLPGVALLQVTQGRLKPTPQTSQLLFDEVLQDPRRHRVEHIELLSRQSFWWMMGFVVLLITAMVIRTDVQESQSRQEGQERAEETFESKPGFAEAKDRDPRVPGSPTGQALQEMYSTESVGKLAFCFVALNTSMILWGIAQEFIMTNVYVNKQGEVMQLPSTLFLVLMNRVCSMLFSAFLVRLRGQPLFFSGSMDAAWPAVSNTCASWCQYSSLHYISFGLQTTAKSVKILPVVIIDSLRGKAHSITDYAECLVLTCACMVFGHESEQGYGSLTTAAGAVLLVVYILMDSITPHLQEVLFQKHKEIDVVQATFVMSTMAVAMMLIQMTLSFKLIDSFLFLLNCPEAILHMLVLSLASTCTQYMISFTVKHFGPVIFTIMASTRQVLSVLVSAVLFRHHISGLALMAMIIMFGTLLLRALRPLARDQKELSVEQDYQQIPLVQFANRLSLFSPLFACTMAIHVVYVVYTLLQEFLSIHTFEGALFNYPLVLVAISHTGAAFLSVFALQNGGHPIVTPGLWKTFSPGFTDVVATSFQHAAMYLMFFPAQSLMKTLKVLPVMVIGMLFGNRSYSRLDWAEGVLLSCLVAFFVYDFQFKHQSHQGALGRSSTSLIGALLMISYVLVDSFTSNLQDSIYQKSRVEPGHMLLGMESFGAVLAWTAAVVTGELGRAVEFCVREPNVILFLMVFTLTAAVGSLSCVLTVRLFGPAVFTLIMTSRAILSLLLSVVCFQHDVDSVDCLSLIAVSIITLVSSARRANAQMRQLE